MEDKELKEKVGNIVVSIIENWERNSSVMVYQRGISAITALIQSERDKAWNEALDEAATENFRFMDPEDVVESILSLKKPTV